MILESISLRTRLIKLIRLAALVALVGLLLARDDAQLLGTANTIPKFTGTASIGDSVIIDNGPGGIDVQTHQIHNAVDPTSPHDVATQAYVLANSTVVTGTFPIVVTTDAGVANISVAVAPDGGVDIAAAGLSVAKAQNLTTLKFNGSLVIGPSSSSPTLFTTDTGAVTGGISVMGGDVAWNAASGPNNTSISSAMAPGWTAAPGGPVGIEITNWAGVVTHIPGVVSTGVTNGRMLILWTVGPTNTLILDFESSNAAANDQFYIQAGVSGTSLSAGPGACLFRYSTAINKWVLIR